MNSINNQSKSSGRLGCRQAIGIVAIIILLGLGYGGYRWHHQHQRIKQSMLAARAYAELLPNLTVKTDTINNEIDNPALEKRVALFMQQYGDTTYGTLLALQWAKYWVEKPEYTQAATVLAKALSQASDPELKAVICLRLARLYHQLKQYDEALKVLTAIKKTERSWLPKRNRESTQIWWLAAQALRGDILQSQQNITGARAAYQQVLTHANALADAETLLLEQLQLQLDDMASSQEQP
ncbi:MAG: tetratricopeptide repeat protein [Candidatus Symbiodolus clandestinus]